MHQIEYLCAKRKFEPVGLTLFLKKYIFFAKTTAETHPNPPMKKRDKNVGNQLFFTHLVLKIPKLKAASPLIEFESRNKIYVMVIRKNLNNVLQSAGVRIENCSRNISMIKEGDYFTENFYLFFVNSDPNLTYI